MRRLVCLVVGHKIIRTEHYAGFVRCKRCTRWVDVQKSRWQW